MGSSPARGVPEQPDRRSRPAGLRPEVTLRLRRPPRFLKHLNDRLVGMDEVRTEKVVAQQVDDRLDGLANLAQNRIRIRLRRRLPNTNRADAKGSSPSACSTSRASPLMFLRPSTASRCK